MCSVWSNQGAQYGASKQCAHCRATNGITVGQSMCSLWSDQCAQCAATNMLTVEQSMCSLWGNQYASRSIQHSCNSAATKTVNIKSIRRRALHAANRNQLCTFSDLIVRSAVKGTTVPSVMEMGHRCFHVLFRLRCGLLEGHGKV